MSLCISKLLYSDNDNNKIYYKFKWVMIGFKCLNKIQMIFQKCKLNGS